MSAEPGWSRPIVGILVAVSTLRSLKHQGPLAVSNFNVRAASDAGVTLFYFSLEGVNISRNTAVGWLKINGSWAPQEMPWPDILYVQRRRPRRRHSRMVFRILWNQTMPINTDITLAKWRTHQALQQYSDTAVLLPHTVPHSSRLDLYRMLKRHQSVYVKPDEGSKGRGICRVWIKRGKYYCQRSTAKHASVSTSFHRLYKRVLSVTGRRCVIQQEIPMLRLGDRKMDVRVLMQKDNNGRWQPWIIRTRIAQPGAIVTNQFMGAELSDLEKELPKVVASQKRVAEMLEQVRRTSHTIVGRLELAMGPMGEIGVDLAYDRNLRLWMIEANARPEKDQSTPIDDVPAKYTRTIGYAKYLYEQRLKERPPA